MKDKHEKKFSQYDIWHIIDQKIKEESARKTAYIQNNGYNHPDVLRLFDTTIHTLADLYKEFDEDGSY